MGTSDSTLSPFHRLALTESTESHSVEISSVLRDDDQAYNASSLDHPSMPYSLARLITVQKVHTPYSILQNRVQDTDSGINKYPKHPIRLLISSSFTPHPPFIQLAIVSSRLSCWPSAPFPRCFFIRSIFTPHNDRP